MKKLYTSASYENRNGEFPVILDDKIALTPLRHELILHTQQLAEAVAEEWGAQKEKIHKETMPLTQTACVAIDLVRYKRASVIEDVLAYADTDLVCYRAGNITELFEQQAAQLDPIVAWVAERFKIQLVITNGLMPVIQPPENSVAFVELLAGYDEWTLAVLAVTTKALSSLILALAFVERRINSAQAFALSHLEEIYETQKWGGDSEKEAKMHKTKEEIVAAERFLTLLMSSKN